MTRHAQKQARRHCFPRGCLLPRRATKNCRFAVAVTWHCSVPLLVVAACAAPEFLSPLLDEPQHHDQRRFRDGPEAQRTSALSAHRIPSLDPVEGLGDETSVPKSGEIGAVRTAVRCQTPLSRQFVADRVEGAETGLLVARPSQIGELLFDVSGDRARDGAQSSGCRATAACRNRSWRCWAQLGACSRR